jgi:cytoskeletal protein CcmA (bactofilin family)
MFSKTAKTEPVEAKPPMKIDTPSPAPSPGSDPNARKPKVATLVAENMTIEGGIIGDGELHVDGVVRGDLKVAKLTIGETGCVEGSIMCETVENRGRVIGTITAKQVRLYASAYVDGDITHEQLAMEIGAFFQGRSLKFQRPAGSAAGQAPATALPKPDAGTKATA